ncbi:F-actin-monooxygenase MICAL3 [Onychomys torridus]|uniref:F-actin-monooxygenase MICAL3 n=1 Tax=Onychomys torridus TaxID=38674 RepID=UPI00167F44EA|nr:F-actin-monooxygenase MICAL3 [Onychomys torridus]XP_036036562.1 F-actin-monooxygenase MICAL3 [Onychomys torridus]XP_036036563.1 F-actin-monooxygenase MICAL3 [Onychomys torridus]XP_036036565.1 F-actin-monooxygenase MICAL3 [Onychomys torridus]XP_036036566.1 F-actin-monooxygenase MICAL3 [Onychomys torridus]XP_036036567.1 F-actin-monooxygenase MICAL3 [Onychomys torridus]XP_036036568.1 F-actin-monooxygenase MICAL3 [Onychomys torridus]XP_036036569.1 F-actin-monooxygenase MICAL3 [Onychomys torri
MEERKQETTNQAHVLFDRFVQATTCKGTLRAFQELCDHLELKPKDYRSFYPKLKSKLNYWKAKALWAKLDKRGSHKDYKKGKACTNTKCLIIGAGPCGLRTAIDLSLLGAKVVVIEKRDAFSRNNVLHLWPFTIHDLRGLGAKKFYGKFCAGAIDHISIRQLQLILLKVALILGIEIHVNVEFQGLVQPPEDQENERIGWRALVHPKTHPVSEYEFEVIIGGDGRRNTLEGFRRKEFRGKLAIAITANFINRNTTAEAKVEEISGVAFIFNQKFFQELREATGIDLENIVYYKDDTHYFVMTAKKQSLLDKGVILHDYTDTELLLSRENVDQEALLNYAREAADFSTQQQLPSLDFAINHYGQPDVAMFDFTCMYASENAALVREQNGHQLLVALVGDSLLEPFWPMGTGIARGFLAAMDSAWMVRSWSLGTSPLEVLAERESIYRLLPQTTPENVSKNFSQYSIDPVTRYPNININFLRPSQVRHLYDSGETKDIHLEMESLVNSRTTPKLTRNESVARSSKLLGWCQRQTDGYAGVNVTDLTTSWKSGLALCAIIHRYRPDLIDFDSLDEQNVEKNNQLAFDIAEKELGISPIMTGKEMASVAEPDKLSMVMYLTQFYEMFKDSLSSSDTLDLNAEEKAVLIASTKSPISFLSKLGQTISRKRSPKDKKEKDSDGAGKRRKTSQSEEEEPPRSYRGERPTLVSTLTDRRMDAAIGNQNKVKYMATQLLAKFEENAPAQSTGIRRQGSIKKEFPQNLGGSDTCYFCQKRVYVMERLSAEGKFFHRSCFKCEYCATTLRLSAYAYDIEGGKFYCKPHYCYRLSGSAQRKRPAVAALSGKDAKGPLQDAPAADANGLASVAASAAERTPGSSMNGLEEPSIAKRLRGTPERIELENYRPSVRQVEELEEVPEETQAEHNLSSVLDKGTEEDAASSSSESEMEEEEEEDEDDQLPTSDLGGVPWKEAVRIHALLKGRSEEELEASKNFEPEEDEEEEEEYEEEEEEEEYDEEEEEESSEAGNNRLQQIITAADPLAIQADVHWTHIREREAEERMLPTSESSTSRAPLDENDLEEDVDSEPAETEGEAAEDGDPGDTGAELDDQHWSDDIPSDAESELRLQRQAKVKAELELRVSETKEEKPPATPKPEERGASQVSSPSQSPQKQDVLFSPAHSPGEEGAQAPLVSVATKTKSPEEPLLPAPLLPREKPKAEAPTDEKTAHSPIRSQPVALPEARTPTSPTSLQPESLLGPPTPPSTQPPICSQPQPSSDASIPSPTESPIRFQPVPAKTSTPLTPLPVKSQGDPKDRLSGPLAVEEALKRSDLVEEFWMKSAEIRRSLGLTPVDRSKASEPSLPSPPFKPVSLKSYSVDKAPQEEDLCLLKPPPVPKRLGLPKSAGDQPPLLTPKSPSDKELRSNREERRDLSSSSGLGLHGSSSNMKTLGSQSFNTSDSTMLTPPSSPPPPPPPNEEPATLRRKPHQTFEHREASIIPPPLPASFMRPPREPTQPPREEVRKSFVESVDEIPFADDVEDTYDDKTEDSSLQEKFFTPPSCWSRSEKLPAKENGRLPPLDRDVQPQKRGLPLVSAEAKELAEERMRAREKSVKSQALRDAMAKQLSRMQAMEMAASRSRTAPSQGKELESAKRSGLRASQEPTVKHEATSEEILSPPSDSGGPDGSVTSSEGSSGKSKKRSSLFSPRRNKKEKKSKGEGRLPEKPSLGLPEEGAAKPKSLWKAVFSGYKKDKKKKGHERSCPSTPSSGATVDSGQRRASPIVRTELQLRRQLSFSEDSDLSSDDILERSSQKSKREPRTYTEEELSAKLTRRVQKAARRQAKQEELKRLHRAQIIQRQLEQVEEKQRQLEERGVAVEKALRGEAGMGKKDDPKLMQEWFKLVQEKNAMVRYESELMIFARELELEDRQSRLQQELRERMAVEDHLKTEEELSEEKKILNEMLEVVEQRDSLVVLLEEQRLREKEEDKDLEAAMLCKGFSLDWS